MRKIILWLLVIFAIFGFALLILANVNPNLFREIKLLLGIITTAIFVILIVILAIFEKKVVRFPFLSAVFVALIAGLIDGILLFKNRYYIGLSAILFVAFVIYLQIKHKKFTNDSDDDTAPNFKDENLEQKVEENG
ncbi:MULTISPECIES: hypothetical protein [unclassified Campylobacter]|uniref:hypothetical protein n=1 Tax=unclassified Campylobacter TaxID=2593542 RepID=UPI0022E9E1BF|nr:MULTISPECIES: hypothetical protein [unclassified Campylobacter]MDA3079714.1 hypothetical protein [Campylobacter sp. CS_NA2]MDA3081526.1 hypothetical protein [Campylobacter sp. CS_NA1]MDA3085811.1 hypothetical protein [Campylobacter sp. CS_ED1]MDA3090546.1 hypothetical protein [Campylobacter sp. CS_ED2]WBR50672.1 hypothetical protein PF026_04760 [Campylobacter sp. CS_NA3]